jgi:hypothetical protein
MLLLAHREEGGGGAKAAGRVEASGLGELLLAVGQGRAQAWGLFSGRHG